MLFDRRWLIFCFGIDRRQREPRIALMWPFSQPYPSSNSSVSERFASVTVPDSGSGHQASVIELPPDLPHSPSRQGLAGIRYRCADRGCPRFSSPQQPARQRPMDTAAAIALNRMPRGLGHHPQPMAAGAPAEEIRLCPALPILNPNKRASSASCSANLDPAGPRCWPAVDPPS